VNLDEFATELEARLEKMHSRRWWPNYVARRWWGKVRRFVGGVRTFPCRLTQRYRKGYNYSDLWNFDHYLAGVLAKAFNELADIAHGYPPDILYPNVSPWNDLNEAESNASFDKWKETLREIAAGFQAYNDFDDAEIAPQDYREEFDKIWDQVKNSCRLMGEHFPGFWD
jgi:hypothetical protein